MRHQRCRIIPLTVLLLGAPVIAWAQTVASLALNPTSVTGGTGSTGTVTLVGPAASGGRVIKLLSDDPSVAAVPDSLVFPAGQTTASFPIRTVPVAQSVAVTIHAAPFGVNRTAQLTVAPPVLSSLTLAPPTSTTGGHTLVGTVSLSGQAPSGGVIVALSSSNPAVASVPASDTVPAGNPTFPFLVTAALPVAQSTPVTITASAGGVTRTALLTVVPPGPSFLSVQPNPFHGGLSLTGTVSLNGIAPSGGVVVALSSSNPAVAAVPASDTVPAGTLHEGFAVATVPVAQPTSVTLTATGNSFSTTAQLTVLPPVLTSFTLAPTSVKGGQSSTGQVTLNGSAPSAGFKVLLMSSNQGLVPVPATVTVPAGQTTASFGVPTNPLAVLRSVAVTVTASAGQVTKAAQLTVTP